MSEIIVQFTAEGADQVKRETVALSNEFDELANAITLSKEKLKGMREGSKEFNTLQREIQATEKTLESMSGSTQKSTTRIRDMREQMINLRQTMQELEKAGLKNTEQYRNLDKVFQQLGKDAASLQDEIGDIAQEVKAASSDTEGLDRSIRGLQLGVNVFGALQAGAALFGGENQQLEKTLIKLNGVMLLSNSLQQIATELTRKDSVAKGIQAAATTVVTNLTRIFGITAAQAWAVATLGIAALIAGIVVLIANFDKVTASVRKFLGIAKSQKTVLNENRRQLEQNNIVLEENARRNEIKAEATDDEIKKLEFLNKAYKQRRQIILNDIEIQKIEARTTKEGSAAHLEATNAIRTLNTDLFELDTSYNKTTKSTEKNTKATKENTKAVLESFSAYQKLKEVLKQANEDLEELIANSVGRAFVDPLVEQIKSIESEIKNVESTITNVLSGILNKETIQIDITLKKDPKFVGEIKDTIQDIKTSSVTDPTPFEEFFGIGDFETYGEYVVGVMGSVFSKIQDLNVQAIQAVQSIAEVSNQRQLNALDERLRKGLISEKQYEKEVAKIKNEQAKRDKRAAIAQAAINIPIAISSAFANTQAGILGKTIAAAIAGVTAAANLAAVIAKPVPKFFKGVIDLPLGNNKRGRDTIPAMLHEGESVMTAAETKRFKPELMAIRNNEMSTLYERKALEIISKNRNLMTPAVDLTPLKMELAWINTRLKEGNIDRRVTSSDLLKEFKKTKVRT